ncbi:hypothetical protein [uncultured Erythrobacter sp.]|uniref:hypothetical protein n=1 Tax=uncultured Erythrobacter sp. TaxID=263913 RepID=UPI00260BD299|nr:hypothetical protein [uncultured Erythrobacter sp.]
MAPELQSPPITWPILAWLTVALAGAFLPVGAMLLFANGSTPAMIVFSAGPIMAVGLMGAGMIAAAASGRFWNGVILALLVGSCLTVIALGLGMPFLSHPSSIGIAFAAASISFAARGALFARSVGVKGWLVAVFVVAGEAAILITAWAEPGALPDWLLALLPAQWASIAIQAALTGTGTFAASSALIALGGTAAATLVVAELWPRRWPYAIMFSAWIGLSALVYHHPGPPMSVAEISPTFATPSPFVPER